MAIPGSIPPKTPEMPSPTHEDVPTREPDERDVPDLHEPPPPDEQDVPSDVEPGSDADIDRGGAQVAQRGPDGLHTERTG